MSRPAAEIRRIVAIEPVVEGYAHAKLNTALLQMLSAAFPRAKVRFLAAPSHLDFVLGSLDKELGIEGEPIEIPRYDQREGPSRIAGELAWTRRFREELSQSQLGLICGFSQLGLAITKLRLLMSSNRTPTWGIIHAILAKVAVHETSLPRRILSPGATLRWPQPQALRFLALGPSIAEAVRSVDSRIAPHFDTLPIPWSWPDELLPTAPIVPKSRDSMVFAVVGGGGARLPEAAEVARGFFRARPEARCRFEYVGYAPLEVTRSIGGLLGELPTEPLSDVDFAKQLGRATYVFGLNGDAKYDFCPSSALHDTFSFSKPSLQLESGYITERLRAFPGTGEVFPSLDALVSGLVRTYDEYDPEEYRQQAAATQRAAAAHEPLAVAPIFRALVRSRIGAGVPE